MALLSLVLGTVMGVQGPPAGWKALNVDGFHALLPSGAVPDKDNKKSSSGGLVWSFTLGSLSYEVDVITLDRKAAPDLTSDRAEAGFEAQCLENLRGMGEASLKRQRDIVVNGRVGLEFMISVALDKSSHIINFSRCFMVGDKIYSGSVAYLAESGRPPTAEQFLNSLAVDGDIDVDTHRTAGPTFSTYSPGGHNFQLSFPAKPKESKTPLKTNPPSDRTDVVAIYGNRTYGIFVVPVPKSAGDPTQGQKNEALAGLVQEMLHEFEAKPVGSPTTLKVNDIETVRSQFTMEDGVGGEVRTAYVDHCVCMLFMIYPNAHGGAADIDSFFNSFKLSSTPPAK